MTGELTRSSLVFLFLLITRFIRNHTNKQNGQTKRGFKHEVKKKINDPKRVLNEMKKKLLWSEQYLVKYDDGVLKIFYVSFFSSFSFTSCVSANSGEMKSKLVENGKARNVVRKKRTKNHFIKKKKLKSPKNGNNSFVDCCFFLFSDFHFNGKK